MDNTLDALSDAILATTHKISKANKNDSLWHELGLLHLQANQLSEAISAFSKAISLANVSSYHQSIALAFKKKHLDDKAYEHLAIAINLDPKNAGAFNDLACLYLKHHKIAHAKQELIKATHIDPHFLPAHENLARILIKEGDLDSAIIQCKNILVLQNNSVFANYQLGNIYLHQDKLKLAKKHYLSLLEVNPYHLEALNNLGTIALKNQQGQQAIDYFTQALAIDNHFMEARSNIAATFLQYDRYENAINHYIELLQHAPLDTEYLYNMGVCQMALGHLDEANYHLKKCLSINMHHKNAMVNLAAIAIREKHKTIAINYLIDALKIDPYDESASYMLKTLRCESADKAPASYVQNLFDNYAINYEKHVSESLQYHFPKQLEEYLNKISLKPGPFLDCLDLGCGTGLLSYAIKPYAKTLTGIDLSEKMLAIARNKSLYDDLIEISIENYLATTPKTFDLMIAGDVFNYFGNLLPILELVKKKLNINGRIIFTLEKNQASAFKLENTGRFTHPIHYVEQVCDELNLSMNCKNEIIIREQEESPVDAFLIELQKMS